MLHVIECAGHPRDMGGLQGQACRQAVVECVERGHLSHRRHPWPALSAFTSGRVRGGGTAREIIRHYTHLSERIDGLARGAGVPTDSLLELHACTLSGASGTERLLRPAVALAASGLDGHAGPTLVRGLAATGEAGPGWILRRSDPEVGFRSLEVTWPWLATAVAGVNESGLALAWVPGRVAEAGEAGAPPFILLIQECLQRFGHAGAAADWCLSRPACGSGSIVIADAAGEAVRVEASRRARQARRADALPLIVGEPARLVESLEESARHESLLDVKALAAGGGAAPPEAFVRLSCTGHSLQLRRLSAPLEEVLLEI
ncbi:MAG: hypothetical protein JRG92_15030 [Deltaproteobacteria bacterium]|nr:hypothetical protein [Deltaproteobacteria bacterium]MBW2384943.1 hypothetical protein [Deltaproteobacteria bacterium]